LGQTKTQQNPTSLLGQASTPQLQSMLPFTGLDLTRWLLLALAAIALGRRLRSTPHVR
jgi:hypothetical protein